MLHDTLIKSKKAKDKAYRLKDGKGLFIEIRPTGAKVWIYRYSIDGKANIYTIGAYTQPGPGHISIDDARAERVRCKALVRAGTHPKLDRDRHKDVRRAEAANTFKAVAVEWLEWQRRTWTPKHANQVERQLTEYVFPGIGAMPLRQIGTPHIRRVMEAVAEQGKIVTALNIRQNCSSVFCYAMNKDDGIGIADPTVALRGNKFKYKRPKVQHKTPLTKDGIRLFRQNIAKSELFVKTKIALELLLLVFVRPGEVCEAEWCEFDTARATWVIPAEKMKRDKEFRIPLSNQVLALLSELHKMTGGGRYLFPNNRDQGRPMSDSTMRDALRRIGYAGKFSPHGFRATAVTELHEMNYDADLIEFQMSHTEEDKVKASYNSAQYWPQRVELLQSWANMVDQWCRDDGGNVFAIKSRAA